MAPGGLPSPIGQALKERARLRNTGIDALNQLGGRHAAISLDCGDSIRIGFDPPEGHRRIVPVGDHQVGLIDPIRKELGQVRPNLTLIPLLAGPRIGRGQTGPAWPPKVLLQTLLDRIEARNEIQGAR